MNNPTLREEGKALVTQATDEQSQQTNAVTYIQVSKLATAIFLLGLTFFLQNLLELKDRFDSFLNNSFSNDKFFKQVCMGILNSLWGFEFNFKFRSSLATLSTSST